MANDVSIWNVLHDGWISGISGAIPGDVAVEVDITYLVEMLPGPASRLVVVLRDCEFAEYHRYVGNTTTTVVSKDWATLLRDEPEILSARLVADRVVVSMRPGSGEYAELIPNYRSFEVAMEDGRSVAYEALVAAAKRYWSRFGATPSE